MRLGIHGQLVYVGPRRLDSRGQDVLLAGAQNTAYLVDTLRACGAVAAHLPG